MNGFKSLRPTLCLLAGCFVSLVGCAGNTLLLPSEESAEVAEPVSYVQVNRLLVPPKNIPLTEENGTLGRILAQSANAAQLLIAKQLKEDIQQSSNVSADVKNTLKQGEDLVGVVTQSGAMLYIPRFMMIDQTLSNLELFPNEVVFLPSFASKFKTGADESTKDVLATVVVDGQEPITIQMSGGMDSSIENYLDAFVSIQDDGYKLEPLVNIAVVTQEFNGEISTLVLPLHSHPLYKVWTAKEAPDSLDDFLGSFGAGDTAVIGKRFQNIYLTPSSTIRLTNQELFLSELGRL